MIDAKCDEGAKRAGRGLKRGGRVEAPGLICSRKPLPSGPGRPGRSAPVTGGLRCPVAGDNQGGTVDFPPLTQWSGAFFCGKENI